MAARSVFKLFAKTCSSTLNSQTPSTVPSVTKELSTRRQQQRSISHSPHRYYHKPKEQFWQIRNVSKSLENLRENQYKDEDYDTPYDTETLKVNRNVFPSPKDMTFRDPAKEFKPPPVEETNDEGNPIYELGESSRSQENVYDVVNFMRKMEYNKMKYSFIHLQPNNIKPYGSFENMVQTNRRKRIKIVYPTVNTSFRADSMRRKKIDDTQYKEFSSCSANREYPPTEKIKKLSVVEPKTNDYSKMKYSTNSIRKKPNENSKRLGFVSTSFSRLSSVSLLKNKKSAAINNKQYHDGMMEGQVRKCNQPSKSTNDTQAKTLSRLNLSKIIKSSQEIFLHQVRTNAEHAKGSHTKDIAAEPASEKYVTLKLSECQDECGKPKKCKQIKKIRFGRLPKLPTSDCPCVEDIPLKEGKPIPRIKKRFDIPDRDNSCPPPPCDEQPRADKHYKIVKKQLPVLKPKECLPCDPREMTDLVIRRLPKRKVLDPPKKCPCLPDCDPCPPRADAGLATPRRVLPKFGNNDCPCIEELPLRTVPLKRLVAKEVPEPPKICPVPCSEMNPERADFGVDVPKKALPVLKGDCACVTPPQMEEGKPFKRLKKIKVKEPPRVCPPPPCDLVERADQFLRVKPRKLPTYTPKDCPCVEPEPPCDVPKLKRLVPKFTPKEEEKVCPPPECSPRADDGLTVTRKQLPVIQVKDCPCVEEELVDCPPLKKLIPRPVFEPKCKEVKVCGVIPRADENIKIKRKPLPPLPPSDCPCIEPPQPLDVLPLKKLVPRPVYPKPCPPVPVCPLVRRADEDLKVEAKKLPKLEAPDCPCIEQVPPDDGKPLKRLKKKHVAEPCRVCPKDECEEMPRADEDDWMYWKCVEVNQCESVTEDINTSNKRSFSTVSRRHYSTSSTLKNDFFHVRYNAPSLRPNSFKQQSHDVIIDIKPSAPLILTQKPLKVSRRTLQRSKSEPVDCVNFVIYKSNGLGKSKRLQETPSEISLIFNNRNRFISTCSALHENSEREKNKDLLKDHQTPCCECPPNDRHLQPKNPIIPEREEFIKPFPSDKVIEEERRKGKMYYRARKDDKEDSVHEEDVKEPEVLMDCKEEEILPDCKMPEEPVKVEKTLTLWEKIVNYFKARPDCPPPEEFKRLRLKEAAERAARKAGLCVYDPKEMLRKNEKELPKVITADSVKEECSK